MVGKSIITQEEEYFIIRSLNSVSDIVNKIAMAEATKKLVRNNDLT